MENRMIIKTCISYVNIARYRSFKIGLNKDTDIILQLEKDNDDNGVDSYSIIPLWFYNECDDNGENDFTYNTHEICVELESIISKCLLDGLSFCDLFEIFRKEREICEEAIKVGFVHDESYDMEEQEE